MEQKSSSNIRVVACRGNKPLFTQVLSGLPSNIADLEFGNFKDGETSMQVVLLASF
jgi:hypothetical protein